MAADASRLLKIVISGDAKGALGAFKETEVASGSLGEKLSSLGPVGLIAGAGIAAGAVAAGTALFKIGESFDAAYDKIRAGTGATGSQLEALKDDFRNVVASVPTDFGKASDAITVITQKLGATGPQLDQLSEQFLELSRITHTDLAANLQAGTDALNAWGVQAQYQSDTLDELFRITQQTGVSFGDLASQLASAQPVFSAAGLGFEESASLLGLLGKNGLDVGDVMPALSKSLATAAKEGKNAAQVFGETFTAIQNAPDDVTAAGDALQVFGAKAGPKFAQLIREGKLNYDDFMQSILTGKDTIIGAGKDTQDFGEKWELFKNRVLLVLEPIAIRVFDGMGKAMDKLGPIVDKVSKAFGQDGFSGVLRLVGQAFDDLSPKTKLIIGLVVGLGAVLFAVVAPVAAVVVAIGGLVAAVVYAYNNFEGFRNVVDTVIKDVTMIISDFVKIATGLWSIFGDTIIAYAQQVWPFIEQLISGVMRTTQGVIDIVTGIIQGDWSQAWNGVREVFSGVWDAIVGTLGIALSTLQAEISGALAGIQAMWSAAWGVIQGVFETVWNAIASAFNWVWDHTIGPIVDKIQNALGVAQDAWNAIQSIAGAVGVGTTDFGQRAAQHVGQNAAGTNFFGGGPTWLNEKGAELVTLPTGSKVTPAGAWTAVSPAAMGDVVINVTVNAGMGVDGQQVGQQVVTVVEEYARRGGTFGPATKAALS